MKTPKEKAEEIFDKFYLIKDINEICTISEYQAKKCALIAINEIIKSLRKSLPKIGLGKGYWFNVRKEIEKL